MPDRLAALLGDESIPLPQANGAIEWYAARNAEWCRLRREGMPTAEIAKQYGMSEGAVRVVVSRYGLGRRPKVESPRNLEWCALYEGGATSGQIAQQFGVSRERVCQILRRYNLIEHKQQRRRIAEEMIEQDRADMRSQRDELRRRVAEIVASGESIASAAAKCGITVPVAWYLNKQAGVQSTHGRHRDFEERIKRVREIVAGGASLFRALEIRGQEEGRKIGYTWVARSCPDLLPKHRGRGPKATATQMGRATQKVSPPPQQEQWSPEQVSELIRLWFKGTSAQQIADILGASFSRNAVLGKLHRLRMAGELKSPAEPEE